MDSNLPGSSFHRIFQARVLDWVAVSFSRRSSQPRNRTQVSHIVGRRFTIWATREEPSRRTKEPLDEGERGSEKAGLKFNIKNKDYDIQSHHFRANRWGKIGSNDTVYFLGLQVIVDGDCSHEVKTCLLLGRKAVTNIDSILKSKDTTLLTKVHIVKAMVFPVVMYRCDSWTIKKVEHWRIDAFELWC